MNELSPKERDLLERIHSKPELRTLFFRKAKGLKWFDALSASGYFNPENIPAPVPAKVEGYINIPRWEAVEYLVRTAHELVEQAGIDYAPHFLEIIVSATSYAKNNHFGNYHVWWQFAEILSQIPVEILSPEHLDNIDYWLGDKYESSLVAELIGTKWLPKLLEQADTQSLALSQRLLEILFGISFAAKDNGDKTGKKVHLKFSSYIGEKVTKKVAYLSGQSLGKQAVLIYQSNLEQFLDWLGNDSWSAIWQPAIEDHEQNKYRDAAENILIDAFRDSLCGYMDQRPEEACELLQALLNSRYQTIERVAIHCIYQYFQSCIALAEILIDDKYLQANYRHEIWHFLHRNYGDLKEVQKKKVLSLIQAKVLTEEDGSILEGASAYEKSTWLAAIKDFGEEEAARYKEVIDIAKTEPDHPDFSSYMTSGWGGQKSPYSLDELSSLSIADLVRTLIDYQSGNGWQEPGIEGLSRAIKQVVKNDPLKYFDRLDSFSELDLAYIYSIIEAYRELWGEKAKLTWDELWKSLLIFIADILNQDRFWIPSNATGRKDFVANRHWIVGSIARLMESGAKSDDHAFPEKYHDNVEAILKTLLKNQGGEQFKLDSDAVSISINSPRGQCIEALINLTLRACRIEDRLSSGSHSTAWGHFLKYFDSELETTGSEGYEFVTLVTQYLPNFLYMSKVWVIQNLPKIFDQSDYIKWSCAMQGYSYVNTVYKEIYLFLKEHGDFSLVLDDENIKDRVEERVIQHIVVGYLNDYESLQDDDSLVAALLNRGVFEELSHLIWFFWTLRKENDDKLRLKVYELWPLLLNKIDLTGNEGKKLASNLCHWAGFVDHLDEETTNLLLSIAPYSDESYNSYYLLECLAKISEEQPFEANLIWQSMLRSSACDYPEEAIIKILTNLVSKGHKGIREAKATVSQYLQKGYTRPQVCLKSILDSVKS